MFGKQGDPKRDPNYLPPQVGMGFQKALTQLVNELAESGNPKELYLKSEYLSKYSDPSTTPPSERRAAAILKWKAVELRNHATNLRLDLYHDDVDFGWVHSSVLISTAKAIIAEVLGPLECATLFQRGSHTNGASTRVKRSPRAALEKHVGKAHVSSTALRFWYSASAGTRLSSQPLELVEDSVLFTVPKSSVIDRVACKEPEVNMYLQRCVGAHIRKRLKRNGIDLNDQTINQRLAKSALSSGLATIDLSSASDSITTQLVYHLLPFDWFETLDAIRVQSVNIDGEIHVPAMFSSMGNGFTFELESLIFWALTRSIAKHSRVKGRISVYGDDIICPSAIGPRLARVFNWFGFRVNPKKSNWSGPIRESCGKHYHRGLDVTPFYLREPIKSITGLIRVLNRLLEWDDCGFKCLVTDEVIAFHKKWSAIVPRNLWGGQDPESISALVTGDKPRQRLVPKRRSIDYDQHAGLSLWLTVKETQGRPSIWKDNHLLVDPQLEGRYIVTDQPAELYRTAWLPYLKDMVPTLP